MKLIFVAYLFCIITYFYSLEEYSYGSETINVQIDGVSYDAEKISANRGPDAIDLEPLLKKIGIKVYDPGLTYTVATSSSISFINGPAGQLLYRGYPIEELVLKDYVEVAYLLIYGQLPTKLELRDFNLHINRHASLKPAMKRFIIEHAKHSDPMTLLPRFIMSLADYYPQLSKSSLSQSEKLDLVFIVLGQIRSFVAQLYQSKISTKVSNSITKNYLHYEAPYSEIFTIEAYQGSEIEENLALASKAINMLLILHADHGQNCSTSTMRGVTSAKASPLFALNAAVSALSGAAHGKANHDVVNLLKEIEKNLHAKQEMFGGEPIDYLTSEIDVVLNKVKNKEMLLPGFGHRIYTSIDPRAKVIKRFSKEVLNTFDKGKSLLTIASALEQAALADAFFINRNLYPNLDFYSGIIYTALEVPEDMLTLMFAFGRISGWLAHYQEMTSEPFKIWRPGQVYKGK